MWISLHPLYDLTILASGFVVVVGWMDVVGPSASEYQFVSFVSSSKWVPFGVFRLHGPLVRLLGHWLCKF